ncbi:MAG TPA: two-component regulator propeller domain-containing protein, partial [Anaerolineaceae bacterium]|nr:two-component regulator propeller domain-containing protein [Anaerolineaceae bacterium]
RFTHHRSNAAIPHSLSNNTVTALLETTRGELWVGTASGLNRFDPESGDFTRFLHDPEDPRTLSSNHITHLFEDRAGNLWVSTADGGINRFDWRDGIFHHLSPPDGSENTVGSNNVTAVLEDSTGNLWIATRQGLDRLDRQLFTFTHYHHDPADPTTITNNNVLSLYEDRSGVLWVGTTGGGVSKYSPFANKFTVFQHSPSNPNSLSNDQVYAIYEDREGIVWVGTRDGGLNRIDRRTGTVQAYRNDPSDRLTISSDDVRAILQDRNGTLWVGTAGGGLNRFNPETEIFTQYRHSPTYPHSISDDTITVLFQDSQGNVWVGTRDGGLNLFNRLSGTFTRFMHDPVDAASLSNNHVQAIWEDNTGYIWVGTAGGLNRMHPVSFRFKRYQYDPRNPNSLSSDNVASIYQDSNGVLWVGTVLGGLNRLDWETDTFRHFTEKSGLANDTVYGILEDAGGHLWLSTNKGLSRLDTQTGAFRNYDLQDGLQSNEFNPGANFRNEQGELFFGGVNGMNVFDPAQLAFNPNPPAVVITAYKEFNQTVQHHITGGPAIELPYSVRFISFEFVALDYNAPDKNQYAYKLEGFDTDWVRAGTRRYVNYTNLKGGDYVFRVRGSNNDGVWNEEGVSIPIRVIPPFWQTWWFIGLVGVGLGVVVWGGYYLRVKSVESLNRHLERQVRERTQEIERRRQVAEGLRDIIAILNSNRPLEESLDFVISQIVRLMGAQAAVLFEQDESKDLRVTASNLSSCPAPGESVFIPNWITDRVLTEQAVIVPDLELQQRRLRTGARLPFADCAALLAVPVSIEARTAGGLLLLFNEPQIFSDETLKTGYMFADQAALAIANARLRAHAEEIAVAAERNRLARDLHDAVTQTLFATSIIADVLPRIWDRNPEEGKKRLLEVRELTRGALAEMRTLLLELRPSALLDAPLGELLNQLCDAFRGRSRVAVKFDGDDEAPRLEPDAQVVFYRIAQEALNNIAKHARASQVTVSLRDDGQRVALQIIDDGVGFDPAASRPDHFGLTFMRERAQVIGAACQIESAPERGTVVSLEWQRPDGRSSPEDQAEAVEEHTR